ncbi:hypothetical protein N5P37_009998, partial [Trichoderma harzianum]
HTAQGTAKPRDDNRKRPKKRLALRIASFLLFSHLSIEKKEKEKNLACTASRVVQPANRFTVVLIQRSCHPLFLDASFVVAALQLLSALCAGSSQPRGGPKRGRDISSIPKFLVALLLGCKGGSTPDGCAAHWGVVRVS